MSEPTPATPHEAEPPGPALQAAWRALAHRASVAGGAGVAVVSLWNHVPLGTVALRGGATWCAVLVTARLGWMAMARALELEARRRDREREDSASASEARA